METLIILSYIALCVIVFKVCKLPVNKWSVTTASVIGLFIVGWIFLYMAMYQPFLAWRDSTVSLPLSPLRLRLGDRRLCQRQ